LIDFTQACAALRPELGIVFGLAGLVVTPDKPRFCFHTPSQARRAGGISLRKPRSIVIQKRSGEAPEQMRQGAKFYVKIPQNNQTRRE
jgi:hypothetical protein